MGKFSAWFHMPGRVGALPTSATMDDFKTCTHCGIVFPRPVPLSDFNWRDRKFCTRVCQNSRVFPKKPKKSRLTGKCPECGGPACSKISVRCKSCRSVSTSKIRKGDLFARRGNWQSARSTIQKHARDLAIENMPQKCFVCGYDLHTEVCHKKAVSEFPETATIAEINAPENLVMLCPNHHWEFDNGHLKL